LPLPGIVTASIVRRCSEDRVDGQFLGEPRQSERF